jgi:CPA1 family monovalent cation:H+ antiporter
MNLFALVSVVVTLTALISYLNYKFIKLPNTIGVMIISLVLSLIVLAATRMVPNLHSYIGSLIGNISLDRTLIQGLLGFILFSGAMRTDWVELRKNKFVIILLATLGVVISAFVYGTGIYFLLNFFGAGLNYTYCLLFGAILSPTDPVAVLGVIKSLKVAKTLEVEISGESLFNDGVGIVLFTIFLEMAVGSRDITFSYVSLFFLEEALGGAAIGAVLAWLFRELIKTVDNHQIEILLTLALVMGCYTAAAAFNISGPIAVSAAGIVIGVRQKEFIKSEEERAYLTTFWEVLDWTTLTVLFVILGLEIFVVSFSLHIILLGLGAAAVLLFARWLSVTIITGILRLWRSFVDNFSVILTWGGLRGGIPVALALSLPKDSNREVIISITYIIVIFSIVVQGLSMKKVIAMCLTGPGK